jgi:hypothetical protein
MSSRQIVSPADLGTGTRDGTRFLRDDGSWQPPAGGGDLATDPLADAKGDVFAASGPDAVGRLAVGSNGQVLTADSAAALGVKWDTPAAGGGGGEAGAQDIGLEYVFDGAGSALTTALEGVLQVPYSGVITSVTLLGDQTGSCVVDVRKATYAAYPTLTSIVGGSPPTIAAAQKATDAVLSGWTTAVAVGDVLNFRFASVSGFTRLTVVLNVQRPAQGAAAPGSLDFYQDGALVSSRPGLNVVGGQVADDAANGRVNVSLGAVVRIGETVLASPAATVTFPSIPQTYRHLELEIVGRTDAAGTGISGINVRFNGDAGANYDWEFVKGGGTTASAGNALNATSALGGDLPQASALAGSPGVSRMRIPLYSGTAFHKVLYGLESFKTGTTAASSSAQATTSWWRSTAAITQIDVIASAGNFVAGSYVGLYGVI